MKSTDHWTTGDRTVPLFLHLSDLHLGDIDDRQMLDDHKEDIVPLARRENRIQALERALSAYRKKLQDSGRRIDAIIVSGDLTISNQEAGFKRFDAFMQTIEPDLVKIVVVQGNHDVRL